MNKNIIRGLKREVNEVIVHCSATPEGRNVKIETIKDWHVNGNGWSDIGYHFVIELDGSIKKGRAINRPGAHTRGKNKSSIGLCYVGGTDSRGAAKDTRTDKQKESMIKLLSFLINNTSVSKISGHNEYSTKQCPCFDVNEYKYLLNGQEEDL